MAEFGIKHILLALVIVVFSLGGMYMAFPDLFGAKTAAETGGYIAPLGLGKLEVLTPGDPVYCLSSGEYGCDKSTYSVVCQDVSATAPEALDITPSAPTEDVVCGPMEFKVRNTGDAVINNIKLDVYSQNPNKIGGQVSLANAAWDQNSLTLRTLASHEDLTGRLYCAYEGGQTSANEEVDISITGVAGSGAKSGYRTFTVKYNCTA